MNFRTILWIILFTVPAFVFSATGDFSRTLSLGMRGDDVRALQKALNMDTETRVASIGLGSLGFETDYFGAATKRALVKFQEKYRAEVLVPAGLTAGTGVFGEKTRDKISKLMQQVDQTALFATASSSRIVTTPEVSKLPILGSPAPVKGPIPWTPDMAVPAGVNINSVNLEYALAEIKKVGARQGISDSEMFTVEKAIRETSATSTDLTKKFLENVKVKYVDAQFLNTHFRVAEESLVGKILVTFGIAKIAHASAVLPFGGVVYWAVPCTCTAGTIWMVGITPLPPTYVTILSYVTGTQLFASYVPTPHAAQSFVGYYWAGVQMCYMLTPIGCPSVPNWGMISPEVGSSL